MDATLLETDEAWPLPESFYPSRRARGLYDPLQFALRLHPEVHRILNSMTNGWAAAEEVSDTKVQAFSTYLHETIHWWQHVGSTTGLILSLLYPTQSHLNHRHLTTLVAEGALWKSLRDYSLCPGVEKETKSEINQAVNVAINNWHDVEYYRWMVLDPRRVEPILQDPFFLYPAHGYRIAIGGVLWLLSSTMDPELAFLPDPRRWEAQSEDCKVRRVEGFYQANRVALPPIGAREIFEGQARFSQVQYLYFAGGMRMSWQEMELVGMFGGVYGDAFNCFLAATGLPKPDSLHDSVIGLFLLVCDIAINPAEGLLFDFPDYEQMVVVHDPGRRFLTLCAAICASRDFFQDCIQRYSAEEYWTVSDLLCELTGLISPRRAMETVNEWPSTHASIRNLLREDETFRFNLSNLPVRVFAARFVRLQQDKLQHPEFFCWPGPWMTGAPKLGPSPEIRFRIFETHQALFVDKEDGNVYPRLIDGRDERDVSQLFNTFYAWVSTYDLTRQWLVGSGEFQFDFSWLSTKHRQSDVRAWASEKFKESFGVHPNEFQILS